MNTYLHYRMRMMVILTIGLIMAACARPEAESVLIAGKVENPVGEGVEVFYYTDFITNNTHSVELTLDENNMFEAEFPLREAQIVYLHVPRRTIRLYLQPGADLFVALDAQDADVKPVISGDQSPESIFLQDYIADIESRYGFMTVMAKAGEKGPRDFRDYVMAIYDEAGSYIREHDEYSNLDPAFVARMDIDVRYEKYGRLMDYPMARSYFAPGQSAALPDDYYDFLEEATAFRDEYVVSRPYFNFLNSYLSNLSDEYPSGDDALSGAQIQFAVARDQFTGLSRELILAQVVISALNFGSFDEAVELYDDFVSIAGDGWPLEIVQNEYKTIAALSPGNPAPSFTLTDIHGEETSLSDFAGKVVYLDFWASWCGPCLREIPHARELKERMADHDDLVFLYVSVDTDEQAWRKAVAEHDISGVHANVPGFNHEVPVSYNLKGVPTFYLIDRDGIIADNRPPRPSNEQIDDVLLTVLEK